MRNSSDFFYPAYILLVGLSVLSCAPTEKVCVTSSPYASGTWACPPGNGDTGGTGSTATEISTTFGGIDEGVTDGSAGTVGEGPSGTYSDSAAGSLSLGQDPSTSSTGQIAETTSTGADVGSDPDAGDTSAGETGTTLPGSDSGASLEAGSSMGGDSSAGEPTCEWEGETFTEGQGFLGHCTAKRDGYCIPGGNACVASGECYVTCMNGSWEPVEGP
jgi:hypothetical protein